MKNTKMTSMERVLAALSFRETDRVPLFLLFSVYGAKELGEGIREYFGRPEWVLEAQKRLRQKYRNDCFCSFQYAGVEIEAWGGEVIFAEEGPPNSGVPFISSPEKILSLEPPAIGESPSLLRVLEVTRLLKNESSGDVPIIGVVMSPFSVPVMQMGFEAYLDLLFDEGKRPLLERLFALNEEFCVRWGNAQIEAGATAICYFDPLASSEMVPVDFYRETGFESAKRVISMIKGPTATHLASARTEKVFDLVAQTGTAVLGFSADDDMAELKKVSANRLTLLGNLDGVRMRRWTEDEAKRETVRVLNVCAPEGGFILSDNHGEIPWSVSEETLSAISGAVASWKYPGKGQ